MLVYNDTVSFPDQSFLQFSSPFDEASSLLLQQSQNDISLHQSQEQIPSNFVNDLGLESMRNHDNHQNIMMESKIRVSSKRDRHSKINTLRGPRDRRMRLSLPVAKEFFGLQDILGFDKASKTVEWLLFQSKHAIDQLTADQHDGDGDITITRSPSSLVSDGEVVSGIDDTTTTVVCGTKEDRKVTRKEKRGRATRKTASVARECREKARARARARTREKQLQVLQNPIEQIEGITTSTSKLQDLSKISSSWCNQVDITKNQGIIDDDDDDCLMIMGRWSPSNSIYNSLQHNNNNGSPQEHSFGDFQLLIGKPWEPYNNHGIC